MTGARTLPTPYFPPCCIPLLRQPRSDQTTTEAYGLVGSNYTELAPAQAYVRNPMRNYTGKGLRSGKYRWRASAR
jgi:hypothetical protein